MVTFTVPAPSRELTSNLFGLVGLVGLVVAVGGLTGSWWWSLAVASVLCVALSWLGHRQMITAPEPSAAAAASTSTPAGG